MGREIAVGGYARVAEGTAPHALYGILTVSAIVDFDTNLVIKAGSNMVSDIGSEWVKERLLGVDLTVEPSPFVLAIQRDYWGLAGPALIQAYKDMARRYRSNLEKERAQTAGG